MGTFASSALGAEIAIELPRRRVELSLRVPPPSMPEPASPSLRHAAAGCGSLGGRPLLGVALRNEEPMLTRTNFRRLSALLVSVTVPSVVGCGDSGAAGGGGWNGADS